MLSWFPCVQQEDVGGKEEVEFEIEKRPEVIFAAFSRI